MNKREFITVLGEGLGSLAGPPSISSVGSTMGQVKPKSDNKWVLGV